MKYRIKETLKSKVIKKYVGIVALVFSATIYSTTLSAQSINNQNIKDSNDKPINVIREETDRKVDKVENIKNNVEEKKLDNNDINQDKETNTNVNEINTNKDKIETVTEVKPTDSELKSPVEKSGKFTSSVDSAQSLPSNEKVVTKTDEVSTMQEPKEGNKLDSSVVQEKTDIAKQESKEDIKSDDKFNIVSIGDSYSSGRNTYGKDHTDSYASIATDDLNGALLNNNIKEVTSQNLAHSGETSTETLNHLNNLDEKEKQTLQKADVLSFSSGGNDLMGIVNIAGVNIKEISNMLSGSNLGSTFNLDSLMDLLITKEKSLTSDGQKLSDDVKKIRDLISALQHNKLESLLTLGSDKYLFSKEQLMSKDLLNIINTDPKYLSLSKELQNIYLTNDNIEKKLHEINKDAQIIRINYPHIFSSFGTLGSIFDNLVEQILVNPLNRISKNNHVSVIDLFNEQSFSPNNKEEFAKLFPNAMDIHTTLYGQQKIARLFENLINSKLHIADQETLNNINRLEQENKLSYLEHNYISQNVKNSIDEQSKKLREILSVFTQSDKKFSDLLVSNNIIDKNDKVSIDVLDFLSKTLQTSYVDTDILKSTQSLLTFLIVNLSSQAKNYVSKDPNVNNRPATIPQELQMYALVADSGTVQLIRDLSHLFENINMNKLEEATSSSSLKPLQLIKLISGLFTKSDSTGPSMLGDIGKDINVMELFSSFTGEKALSSFDMLHEKMSTGSLNPMELVLYAIHAICFSDGRYQTTSNEEIKNDLINLYDKYKSDFKDTKFEQMINKLKHADTFEKTTDIFSQYFISEGLVSLFGSYKMADINNYISSTFTKSPTTETSSTANLLTPEQIQANKDNSNKWLEMPTSFRPIN